MPLIALESCPLSLNAASMTLISVAVVSRPVKEICACMMSLGSTIKTVARHPVVHDHAGANDVRTSIDRTGLCVISWRT